MRNTICLFWTLVSFLFITAFVTTLTFGACSPDVSGTWEFKIVQTEACCSDSSDNGQKKLKLSIEVTQDGDEISATWTDEDGDQNTLTGVVYADSVFCKIEGINSDNSECGYINYVVGIIKNNGKQIVAYGTGADTGGCNTCKWYGTGKIKITSH